MAWEEREHELETYKNEFHSAGESSSSCKVVQCAGVVRYVPVGGDDLW